MESESETNNGEESGSSPSACCAPPELQELCDLITGEEGASFEEAKAALKMLLEYRTSKRIKFITDKWGGRDETHFELDALGLGLQVTITDDNIHVVGQRCFEVDKHSGNAMNVTRREFSRHNAGVQLSETEE